MPRVSSLLLLVACALAAAACTTSENAATGGAPHGVAATVSTTTFTSLHRLTPSVDVATGSPSASLTAARGEREGFQFAAWADRGSPRVVLVPRGLTGPGGATIASKHVKALIEQPVTVEHGSPAGRRGVYTDALLPAPRRDRVLAPGARLLAWADVYVPLTAAPGTYTGAIEVRTSTKAGRYATGSEGLLASVPYTVVVRAATLPDRPTLGSSIGVDASQIVRFEQVEAGSPGVRTAVDNYAKVLAEARLSIADVEALPPTGVPGASGSAADAAYLKGVFDRRGVASVRIPFYATYPFEDPLGADRPQALAYLRGAAKWARANDLLDRAYVYVIDEPGDERAGEVRELHELVRAADPALRLLVTRESSAKLFAGSVDIWVPNISSSRFRVADVNAAKRAGQPTWWYPSITSWQPQPTMFIDDVRPAPRAMGWLAWRYGVSGMLYWSATHWHEVDDPYADPGTYNETDVVGNGDGTLLYPGGPIGRPGRPTQSVRLLELRDGIDDHDLLTMATCEGTAAERAALARAAAAVAPNMTTIVPTDTQVATLRELAFDVLDRAADAGTYDPASRVACAK